MQTKTRKIFMGLVGVYLVYTGAQLINSVLEGNPKNKVGFIICGAVFVLFGAFTVVYNIAQYIKESKAETPEDSDTEAPDANIGADEADRRDAEGKEEGTAAPDGKKEPDDGEETEEGK